MVIHITVTGQAYWQMECTCIHGAVGALQILMTIMMTQSAMQMKTA